MSQAEALLACDFFETVTLTGTRMFVLAVIEHHSRRTGCWVRRAHPSAPWVTQAARNLVMDPQDAGCRARFLVRDRDGKFPGSFDAVLAGAGITVVLTGVRMPRMNAARAENLIRAGERHGTRRLGRRASSPCLSRGTATVRQVLGHHAQLCCCDWYI